MFTEKKKKNIHRTSFPPRLAHVNLSRILVMGNFFRYYLFGNTDLSSLIRGEFGEHFISCSAPVILPPGSYDLTPLDYFLLGYVHVFTDKFASIDALEDSI